MLPKKNRKPSSIWNHFWGSLEKNKHTKSGKNMGVSKNRGTPKSSILIGFSIIFTIHFGGFPPIFGNTHMFQKALTFHVHQKMTIPNGLFFCEKKKTFEGHQGQYATVKLDHLPWDRGENEKIFELPPPTRWAPTSYK